MLFVQSHRMTLDPTEVAVQVCILKILRPITPSKTKNQAMSEVSQYMDINCKLSCLNFWISMFLWCFRTKFAILVSLYTPWVSATCRARIDFKQHISHGSSRPGLRTEPKENADIANVLGEVVNRIFSGFMQMCRRIHSGNASFQKWVEIVIAKMHSGTIYLYNKPMHQGHFDVKQKQNRIYSLLKYTKIWRHLNVLRKTTLPDFCVYMCN